MDRLCGRPGCSDRASVAYGMRAEDLVFWLDRLPEPPDEVGGVLCRRHADSMVVPRGWTLDDLRDPDLHLFRPPTALPSPPRGARPRPSRASADVNEQLELVARDPAGAGDRGEADSIRISEPQPEVTIEVVDTASGPAGAPDGPWTPDFDEADDLDGLLSARSPLLSRAFRVADRPDA